MKFLDGAREFWRLHHTSWPQATTLKGQVEELNLLIEKLGFDYVLDRQYPFMAEAFYEIANQQKGFNVYKCWMKAQSYGYFYASYKMADAIFEQRHGTVTLWKPFKAAALYLRFIDDVHEYFDCKRSNDPQFDSTLNQSLTQTYFKLGCLYVDGAGLKHEASFANAVHYLNLAELHGHPRAGEILKNLIQNMEIAALKEASFPNRLRK